MIKRRVPLLEYYKGEGLNLYPVIEKRPGHYVNNKLVGLSGWDSINDFNELSRSIKSNDNYGFRTGIQYKSNKNIIVLDFDNNSKQGASARTINLYDRFSGLDTNNKLGIYESSTCGNYGVLVDITNCKELKKKIEEVSGINKNKIEVEHLEILYNSNVILPPSKTTCKVHQKIHKERKYLSNICGFCIPNEEQINFIAECLDRYIKNSKRNILKKERDVIVDTNNEKIEVRRIPTGKMLGILECLKETRFLAGYNDWIKLLYMIANSNNSSEVIKKFWESCKVGRYSTVSLEHINSFFSNCDIEPEFNNAPLWKLAREDNPSLFANIFNRYDEPQFKYNKITFKTAENKNTKFINYNQVMEYFTTPNNTITKLNVICSGLGTGKTSFIEQRVKLQNIKASRIIFITMRQSLAYSIMSDFNKLGFKNYLDKSNKVNYYTSKLIISLDSLEKITLQQNEEIIIPKYDLVICDEIASLLSHFSYQNIHNVEKVYRIFIRIIKDSKECYLMDGDISNREILWLKNYMDYDVAEQKLPLFNELKGAQHNLVMSYCANSQYNRILKDLEEGKNICVVSMSATEAEKLYELLNQKYSTLLIISRTGDKQKKELENVNDIVAMYRCFIYSPTITVGVNIDCIHFDKIYGYVCEGSVCARDYYQMLNRIRNPRDNTINILIGSFNMKFHGLYNVVPFETYKKSIYDEDMIDGLNYIKLWNKWENDHKALWLDIFKWYAEKKGHRMIIEESSKELFQIEKDKFKENLERLQLEINSKPMPIEEIYNTPRLINHKLYVMSEIITNEERDRICAKSVITDEDKVVLDKIDKDNGWNLPEIIQERVRLNIANSFDKARLEKTLYCNMFDLNDNSTLEEFKNVYNKIGVVINNAKLNNLAGIDDLLSLVPVDNRSLDELILSKKLEYIKKIQRLLNINDFNNARHIDNIDYNGIRDFVNDKNMSIVFGIINIDSGTKKIKKNNNETDSNIKNINTVKKIIQDYGYVLNSKQVRNGNERKYVYSIDMLDAVKKYISIQKRNQDIKVQEELDF